MVLAMCFFVPVFSYAQAQHIALGTNVSNAPAVADTVSATVTDGEENYFKIEAAHLQEMLGHRRREVFAGVLLGIVTAIAVCSVWDFWK